LNFNVYDLAAASTSSYNGIPYDAAGMTTRKKEAWP